MSENRQWDSWEHRYNRLVAEYALFDTAIGWVGIAWGDKGLVGVYLPERDPEATRRGLRRRFPEAAELRFRPGSWRRSRGYALS